MILKDIEEAMAAVGLTARGAFHPGPKDGVPALATGAPVTTLVLAGNVGPDMWAAFSRDRNPKHDRLDDWSEAVLNKLAGEFDAAAFFPFQKPYLPFQRWARNAEPCHVSPLGILIHPDYGLWHGYRGALGFAEFLELPPPDERPSPCDICPDKPCLDTCPVGAFSDEGYDMPACVGHLQAKAGRDCMQTGCRARRACPVGRRYIYRPEQANFHMTWFLRRHSGGAGSAG